MPLQKNRVIQPSSLLFRLTAHRLSIQRPWWVQTGDVHVQVLLLQVQT